MTKEEQTEIAQAMRDLAERVESGSLTSLAFVTVDADTLFVNYRVAEINIALLGGLDLCRLAATTKLLNMIAPSICPDCAAKGAGSDPNGPS